MPGARSGLHFYSKGEKKNYHITNQVWTKIDTECSMLTAVRSLERSDATINVLSTILQRIQRVEKQMTEPPYPSLNAAPHNVAVSIGSPQPVLSNNHEMNVAVMLREAVSQVQKLRLKTFSKNVITQHVHIPPKLAKMWIEGNILLRPRPRNPAQSKYRTHTG